MQIKEVGEAVGGNAQSAARANVRVAKPGVVKLQLPIFHARNADKDARGCAAELVGGNAGIFQRLPGHLQQQPLLRVHAFRLAWRNAKKGGVELVNLFQKAAPAGVHLPWLRVRVIEGVHVPAGRWRFADGVHAIDQQFPERLWARRPRKATAHPHNRYRPCLLPLSCRLFAVICCLFAVIC